MAGRILKPPFSVETPRIWLETLSIEKHLDDFHELWSNPGSLIWSTQNAKTTPQDSEIWMEPLTKSSSRPWIANFAVLLRPIELHPIAPIPIKPKMIGTVGVHGLVEVAEGHRHNIGYMINHDYWGKGYATEALAAFLRLWFETAAYENEELIAQVDTENWASMRILEKMATLGYGLRQGELQKGVFEIPKKGLRDMRIWYISKDLR